MVVGGYISVDVMNPIGWYQELFVVNVQILDYKIGHYVRPNKVAFKYLDLKRNVNPNAHVRVFNFTIKANI
jgi:hypothetical protein